MEQFPERASLIGWPDNAKARACAKSAVCELHSGFSSLHQLLPFNIRKRVKIEHIKLPKSVKRDIQRLQALLTDWYTADLKPVSTLFLHLVAKKNTVVTDSGFLVTYRLQTYILHPLQYVFALMDSDIVTSASPSGQRRCLLYRKLNSGRGKPWPRKRLFLILIIRYKSIRK